MKPAYFFLSLGLLASVACSDGGDDIPAPEPADMIKQITIDGSIRYQTIDGFGASDCWYPTT